MRRRLALPFPLLADPGGAAAKALGALPLLWGRLPRRATFVWNGAGKLLLRWVADLLFRAHAIRALQALGGRLSGGRKGE